MVPQKWGPHYKMLVLLTFVSYHLVISEINQALNMGQLTTGNCKSCGHLQHFAEKPQGRTLNVSLWF